MDMKTVIPGYVVGSWRINPFNSDVSFTVRHLGVSWVHGRFNDVTGEVVTGDTLDHSSVSATITAASIDTGFAGRDTYIRGENVLAASDHKKLSFVSTGIRNSGSEYWVDGDLTIRGISKPVTLLARIGGFGTDPAEGDKVVGISAATTIARADFGFSEKIPSSIIGGEVEIRLDIQATLNA